MSTSDPSVTVQEVPEHAPSREDGQSQSIEGENMNETARTLIGKFGKRYTDIVKQYGTFELIKDQDGNVLDIACPAQYLEESDRSGIERYHSGDHDSPRPIMTAGALARLAAAELRFYATEYDELRTDPEYLRSTVEEAARHRIELLPDEQGNAPNIGTLLSNSRFVGQLVRFTLHNTLMQLGMWAITEKYLSEIQELDDRKGRLGAPRRRHELMSHVKFVLEEQTRVVSKRVRRAVVFHTLETGFRVRVGNFPDYSGAHDVPNPAKLVEIAHTIGSGTTEGAFVRFISEDMREDEDWDVEKRHKDLFSELDREPERWETLGQYLAEQLTQLQRMMDFTDMLGHADAGQVPSDDRFKKYADALQQSEKTFTAIALERHIRSIASLEQPNTFAKVWKEIDTAFSKKYSRSPENLVGFVPFGPKWYLPDKAPVIEKRRVPLPLPPPPPPPALPTPGQTRARPPPAVRPPSPTPVKLTPYNASTSGALSTPPSTIGEDPATKGAKVKTRGTQSNSSSRQIFTRRPNTQEVPQITPAVFSVPKRAYDIFERIFKREKGQLSFADLSYALASIGFGYKEAKGSRGSFYRTSPDRNDSFLIHSPHGAKPDLHPLRLRWIAKDWESLYGWTMDWFSMRSPT
ncbi:hypothetical protein BDN71DRAFT_1553050 [Pleurotus eryngii]|uniref:Uncharacterized protein n=1 Tax=Pleurotus eryngii TaxID=5323 RepID=A0A9P6D9E8_PLEER|nr:hypothetical protein BDN71DRAFT_1553050 [Pleurotus eryngii]